MITIMLNTKVQMRAHIHGDYKDMRNVRIFFLLVLFGIYTFSKINGYLSPFPGQNKNLISVILKILLPLTFSNSYIHSSFMESYY